MTSQRIALLLLAFLAATGARAATIELTVNGLVCGFCAQGIEKTLRRNAATDDVFVSLENRLVAVATKPDTDIADESTVGVRDRSANRPAGGQRKVDI